MAAPAQLQKIIGRREVLGLAFGAMIGWSWVVLSGEMIVRAGTLGSILALLAGGVMVLLVGLTYAELTPALARAGGELTFVFLGLGRVASFVCGWTLVLAYFSVCAFEAVALPTVAGFLFPDFQVGYLYTVQGWDVYVSWVLLGTGGAFLIGVINYLGIRFASFLQWMATLTILVVGLAFVLGGTMGGSWANLSPHFTGWPGFFRVMIMTPFLFVGFDVIPQVAEEIKVPPVALGRLVLFSIGLACLWYVLVQWSVGLSLSPLERADTDLPTAQAMSAAYQSPLGGRILVLGGLLGIMTSWNAFFIGATRLLFAMSRGGMLPAVFSRLHPRYQSPVAAVLLIGLLSMLAPLWGRPALVWLVNAGSLATVLAYVFVAASFLSIQRHYPNLPRPYRVRRPRLVGTLALLATLGFLVLYLPGSPSALIWPHEWAIVLAWAVPGVILGCQLMGGLSPAQRAAQAQAVLGNYAGWLASTNSTEVPREER